MTRALVIDDSRSMRSILGRILAQIEVQVEEASDGQSALQWLEAGNTPDFILVDWHMPVMDGIEFVAAVRNRPEKWSSVPIMVVSTESDTEHVAQALASGANEYLIKPFTADAVSAKLDLLDLLARDKGVSPSGPGPGSDQPAATDTGRT